jgi:carbon-monoxide dehydrogenase large subunit
LDVSKWLGRRYVGAGVRRIEDERLLRGRGEFLDDIKLPGALHAAFVRSEYPHALVKRIDVADALKVSGVVAVYTWREISEILEPETFDVPADPMYPLARDKVRYYGEPLAVVLAEDPGSALDGAEAVSVDYEPLEPVASVERALEKDAPRIHETAPSNVALDKTYQCGDVDKAFREAPVVVEDVLYNGRVYAASMEPRGVAASFDGERLTVWASTQTPFDIKEELEERLKVRVGEVRVIEPDVGGAFGAKIPVYPEYVLIPALAVKTGRPVKWYASRREDIVSTTHGRDIRARMRLAADRSGRILGLDAEIVADLGAYPVGYALPIIAARILSTAYDIRSGRARALAVYTNKTPLGAYRGAGRPEANFFMERMMDLLADELGMDPVEVRLINMVRPEAMPYTNCFGWTYDSGDYPGALREALEKLRYREAIREAEKLSSWPRLRGVGLAFYVEITSGGPFESARVRLEPDGSVTIVVGSTPTGQGDATGFAQLAADILGVDISRVRVLWGDTGLIKRGVGTFGSRTMAVGGGAVIRAVEGVIAKARRVAAEMLGVPESKVAYEPGSFYVSDDPQSRVSIEDVARAAAERGVNLEEYVEYDPGRPVYPFGVHMAIVEVDAETGIARVVEYRSLDDVGRVVNPVLVEGQIVGGVMQGIGQVLYEEVVYDESGYPRTLSLADYGVPTAAEAPLKVEVHLRQTPTHHPHGVRGVGEIGSIAAPPAIVKAIEDALRKVNPKARIKKTPVRPEEILAVLREARKQ